MEHYQRYRVLYLALLGCMLLGIIVMSLRSLGYGIIYQFSASMPTGWYVYAPLKSGELTRGEVVLFYPKKAVDQYIVDHHWMAPGTIMIKHVAAIPGDWVCVKQHQLWINHKMRVKILSEYAPGKFLPTLQICRDLKPDEYMLLSTRIPNSFDSRYFGPVNRDEIIAKGYPL